jgi:hypothetical protein
MEENLNKKKKIIETVAVTAAGSFFLKAALQGIIGWIAARFFAGWWEKHVEKKVTDEVVEGVSTEE